MAAPKPVPLGKQKNIPGADEKNVEPWTSFEETTDHQENGWTTFLDTSQGRAAPLFKKPGELNLEDKGQVAKNYSINPKTAIVSPMQKEIPPHEHPLSPDLRDASESSMPHGPQSIIPSQTLVIPPAQYTQMDPHQYGQALGTMPMTSTATAQGISNPPGPLLQHLSPMPSQSQVVFNRPDAVYSSGMPAYIHTPKMDYIASQMHVPPEEHVQRAHRHLSSENSGDSQVKYVNESDPWRVTEEQRNYYTNQFATMQPHLNGKIDGQTARNFFTKSRLPIPELSHIWELCDMDQDGHLTLDEFSAAFHLVVARKNGYDLPSSLPPSLLPSLVGVTDVELERMPVNPGTAARGVMVEPTAARDHRNPDPSSGVQNLSHKFGDAPDGASDVKGSRNAPVVMNQRIKSQDNWETFSERTSSSTTLANFDQDPHNTETLAHPIALRVTPSRHEAHSARILAKASHIKSADEGDSSPPYVARIPIQHRSLTNPYGSLTNDFSETESGVERSKLAADHRRASSTSSSSSASEVDTLPTSAALNPDIVKRFQHRSQHTTSKDNTGARSLEVPDATGPSKEIHAKEVQKKYPKSLPVRKAGRRSKASSHSSCDTSERSSSEVDVSYHPPANNRSDQECSDWSSRPLRPRSGSDSSVESPTLETVMVPGATPSAVPIPPPRPNQNREAKTDFVDQSADKTPNEGHQADMLSETAPTPPPRSELSMATKAVLQHEVFADFSQFNGKTKESQLSRVPAPAADNSLVLPAASHIPEKSSGYDASGENVTRAPTRPLREEKPVIDPDGKEGKEKLAQRKPPTKPPRSRILSTASGRVDQAKDQSEHSLEDSELQVPRKPNQEEARTKTLLQQSIRDLKLRNSQLTQMNAELQRELKDVMQSRITVEMSIHQLRPFSQ